MTSSEIEFVMTNVYKIASTKLREKWNAWYDETINIDMYIQTMLNDLETQEIQRTDAINIIVEDHKDLKGFSRSHIYRSLPKESKRKYNNYNMLPNNTDVSNETFGELQENIQKDENITKNVNIPPRAENIIEADTISDQEIKVRTKLEKVGYDLSSDSDSDQNSNSLLEQINILNHRLDSVEKVVTSKDEEIASLQRQLKNTDQSLSEYVNRNRELEKQLEQKQSTTTVVSADDDDEKDIEITALKKELAESKKSFRDEVSVFYKEQEIPLKCFASPLTKTITVDIDMDKVEKLYGGSGR